MIERWMECLNDNTREDYKIMALSYMQKSQLAATAGTLILLLTKNVHIFLCRSWAEVARNFNFKKCSPKS